MAKKLVRKRSKDGRAAKDHARRSKKTPSSHSFILLDRTGSMTNKWSEAISAVNVFAAFHYFHDATLIDFTSGS